MAPLKLVVLEGLAARAEYEVGPQGLSFGRAETCSVVLDDPDASREHARISQTAQGFVVEDLGSRNGTIVNGDQIQTARALRDGDLLVIGRTLFAVELEESRQTPKSPEMSPISRALSGAASSGPAEPLVSATTGTSGRVRSDLLATASACEQLQGRLASVRSALEALDVPLRARQFDSAQGGLLGPLDEARLADASAEAEHLFQLAQHASGSNVDQLCAEIESICGTVRAAAGLMAKIEQANLSL